MGVPPLSALARARSEGAGEIIWVGPKASYDGNRGYFQPIKLGDKVSLRDVFPSCLSLLGVQVVFSQFYLHYLILLLDLMQDPCVHQVYMSFWDYYQHVIHLPF